MDLKDIISISGKTGLFSVVGKSKNNVIVESIIDKKRFPITQVLKNLPNHDSLYETILVAANDKLVQMFLDKKIKFSEISQFLLRFIVSKEFNKYKSIKPSNIKEIEKLRDYVSLKIETKCV